MAFKLYTKKSSKDKSGAKDAKSGPLVGALADHIRKKKFGGKKSGKK